MFCGFRAWFGQFGDYRSRFPDLFCKTGWLFFAFSGSISDDLSANFCVFRTCFLRFVRYFLSFSELLLTTFWLFFSRFLIWFWTICSTFRVFPNLWWKKLDYFLRPLVRFWPSCLQFFAFSSRFGQFVGYFSCFPDIFGQFLITIRLEFRLLSVRNDVVIALNQYEIGLVIRLSQYWNSLSLGPDIIFI